MFIQDILNFPYNKLIENNNYLQFRILMNDSVVVVDVMYRYLHISNISDNTHFFFHVIKICEQNNYTVPDVKYLSCCHEFE